LVLFPDFCVPPVNSGVCCPVLFDSFFDDSPPPTDFLTASFFKFLRLIQACLVFHAWLFNEWRTGLLPPVLRFSGFFSFPRPAHSPAHPSRSLNHTPLLLPNWPLLGPTGPCPPHCPSSLHTSASCFPVWPFSRLRPGPLFLRGLLS